MAPPKKPWFRMYCEVTGDGKIRSIPLDQRWVWVAVMSLARTSPIPGFLMLSEAVPCSDERIADEAAAPLAKTRAALSLMERLGMIHRDQNLGCWVVTNFGRRQFESDDSTPRSRKRRNGDATPMQRPINGDATDQRQTTESETEVLTGCTETTDDLQSAETSSSSSDPIEDLEAQLAASMVDLTAYELAALLWPDEATRKGIHPSKRNAWISGTKTNLLKERRGEIMALVTEGLTPKDAAKHLHAPAERPTLRIVRPVCETCHGAGHLPSDPDHPDPYRQNHSAPCPDCNQAVAQ